jgi:hypothetical protein
MSVKLARRTTVNKAFRKKADFWKFSSTMIVPIVVGLIFGTIITIIFQLDYIWMILNWLWPPLGWAIAVGDRSPGHFVADFARVPLFGFKRERRKRLLRK